MSDATKQFIQEILQNQKLGASTAAITTGTGISAILDVIPDDISKLATLIGIVATVAGIALTIVLIKVNWANYKKVKLENDKLIAENKILNRIKAEDWSGDRPRDQEKDKNSNL